MKRGGLALVVFAAIVWALGVPAARAVVSGPVANNDTYTTPSDTQLVVAAPGYLANDTGLGGGEAPHFLGSTSSGTFVPQVDGSFVYTPNPGFHGLDEAAYCLSTTSVCESAAAFIAIHVVAPVAAGDAYSMPFDTTLTVVAPGFLGNDTGINSPEVPQFIANAQHGSFVSQTDGSFVYTPTLGYHGVDTLAYCIAAASICETSNVFIDITVVGPPPPVANDDGYSTPSDVPLTVAAPGYLANDTGLSGGEAPIFLGSTSNGSFAHQPDGSFVYTPNPGTHGLDQAAYCLSRTSVCESAAAFISIQVVPPVANDDSYTIPADTILTVPAPGFLGNDTGIHAGEVPFFLGNPSNGTFTPQADGSFTYSPNLGSHGLDTAAYCLTSTSTCESAAAFINIQVVPPTAVSDSYSMPMDTTLTSPAPGFLGNDTGIAGGQVPQFIANATHGSFVSQADGSFVYTPNVGFHGLETLAYCLMKASICETPNVFIDITVFDPATTTTTTSTTTTSTTTSTTTTSTTTSTTSTTSTSTTTTAPATTTTTSASTTTTTTAPTTTTTAGGSTTTSTTSGSSTTTTSPTSSSTSTTDPSSSTTSTTAGGSTTSTTRAGSSTTSTTGLGVLPASTGQDGGTTTSTSPNGSLPVTGGASLVLVEVGLALVLVGLAAVMVNRRERRSLARR